MKELHTPDNVVATSAGRSQKRQVTIKTVGLYPSDIEMAEEIREHYGLDSFAQAVRRAIRMAADHVAIETRRIS